MDNPPRIFFVANMGHHNPDAYDTTYKSLARMEFDHHYFDHSYYLAYYSFCAAGDSYYCVRDGNEQIYERN